MLFALGTAPVLALGIASAAQADRGVYRAFSFTEAADPGLTVSKPLDEFVAVSRARIIAPDEWQRQKGEADQLRFISPGGTCRYRISFSLRSKVGEPGDAADYVAAGLPAAGSRYVLDSGRRGGSAFRVIREKTSGANVQLRALRASVLTRRSDIAPKGQAVWNEVRVTATSRPGDECHSGTYRERLGPQLGDALATARTNLAFVRKPKK
jgi:hypothetical protein